MRRKLLVLAFIILILVISGCKTEEPSGCNYDNPQKKYTAKTADECSRIRFICAPGYEYFSDECGCGCQVQAANMTGNYCTDEQRNADACITIYDPVCGWFDPERIQCIKYPCANTFSNSCFACSDDKVLYWTEGECPK